MPYYRCQPPQVGENPYVLSINGVDDEYSSMVRAFAYNTDFNDNITVGSRVNNCRDMLFNCYNFNGGVVLGDNVTDMAQMFYHCHSFNQPIHIPDSVKNMYYTFYGCENFNQPIEIPNTVETVLALFRNCYNFNQPITIPNNANTSYAFMGCYKFNQPITSNGEWARQIFDHSAMNCDVTFGPCTYVLTLAFNGCQNFGKNVYVNSVNINVVGGMFNNCNNALRKNIWFNSVLNDMFGKSDINSVVSNEITWTTMTNGFYNTAYNIYCYNNYVV